MIRNFNKKKSESLVFTGLKIYGNYIEIREERRKNGKG